MSYFECSSVTKNDESTFFAQNVDCLCVCVCVCVCMYVCVCARLGIAEHDWERQTLS